MSETARMKIYQVDIKTLQESSSIFESPLQQSLSVWSPGATTAHHRSMLFNEHVSATEAIANLA
jgi:hypothetical protein